jgi:hypothetical protein
MQSQIIISIGFKRRALFQCLNEVPDGVVIGLLVALFKIKLNLFCRIPFQVQYIIFTSIRRCQRGYYKSTWFSSGSPLKNRWIFWKSARIFVLSASWVPAEI